MMRHSIKWQYDRRLSQSLGFDLLKYSEDIGSHVIVLF